MPTYTVLRQHLGERMYLEGEMREAAEAEVAHLIAAGVLGASDPEPEPAPKPRRARKAGDA
ncbi:hypothetical protein BYZ73_13705 [Rhodovulum viride]|uniref:ROS/MUCR transcriptional regulator protein n=1 Tax=Rhodovulum viride TaxID=1231134 RepID=A0ABX9DGD8_9RHOB|nr:hypothetical protein [Rhodovulum viride]RAP40640.1 hypothetical protein BYZ73_13705 [Rhodovulum viride]